MALRFGSAAPWKPRSRPDSASSTSRDFVKSDTVTIEIFGNVYLYTEEYHESWMEWWQGTPGYIAYTAKYGSKKKLRWNSKL